MSPFEAGCAVALDFGLDDGDGTQAWEARLAGEAPGRGQPGHVVADAMAAHRDAAMVAVGRLEGAVEGGRRVVQVAPDLVVQAGLVVLDDQQVVAAPVEDGLGDLGLTAHGVDGDECAAECQAFEQKRNGGDLVGLGLAGLLSEYQALAAGPGRDHVERASVLAVIMRSPRGLAIDGDDFWSGHDWGRFAQAFNPGGKALGKDAPSMALMTLLSVS